MTVARRGFQSGDLDGAFFVISATDDRAVNSAVAAEAEGIPNSARKAAWERVLNLPLLDWLRKGRQQQAKEAAEEILAEALSK